MTAVGLPAPEASGRVERRRRCRNHHYPPRLTGSAQAGCVARTAHRPRAMNAPECSAPKLHCESGQPGSDCPDIDCEPQQAWAGLAIFNRTRQKKTSRNACAPDERPLSSSSATAVSAVLRLPTHRLIWELTGESPLPRGSVVLSFGLNCSGSQGDSQRSSSTGGEQHSN